MRLTLATCLAAAICVAGPALTQTAPSPAPPSAGPPDSIKEGLAPLGPNAAPTGAAAAAAAMDPKAALKDSKSQAIEGVAVLVNDDVISYYDVRNRARLILLSFPGKVDDAILQEAQGRAIEGLIEEKIELREYRKLSPDRDIGDDEIDDELDGIAKQNNMTKEKFVADIVTRGVNPETLRQQVKADLAWQQLVRGRFRNQVRVSELRIDEMMARYKAQIDKPQYHLSEIFLYAPDKESRNNAHTRAATLQAQIEKGAPFPEVAQQFSAAPSAAAGGDLGWLSQADMLPAVEAEVIKSKPVSFLPPIDTDNGVYLIAFLGKREAANPNEAKVSLKQIVAKGDDAVGKLNAAKAKTKSCADVAKAAAADTGLNVVDLNDVALTDMSDQVRTAVSPLKPGEATGVLDVANGKAVLFVCQRAVTGTTMPTRDQVKSKLFETEISMMADRYLRDLKREATISRR